VDGVTLAIHHSQDDGASCDDSRGTTSTLTHFGEIVTGGDCHAEV
jgi:hypothetical protein